MPTTDLEPRTGREGFTLVEVLVAMIILAIGLLALEAMGIGAARAVARADIQSEYTAVATDRMEQALALIRAGDDVEGLDDGLTGASVTTEVDEEDLGNNTTSYTVTVTVTPTTSRSHLGVTLSPVEVVGRVIR